MHSMREFFQFHTRFALSFFRRAKRLSAGELGDEFVRSSYLEIYTVLRYLYLFLPFIFTPFVVIDVYEHFWLGSDNGQLLVFDVLFYIALFTMLIAMSLTPLHTGERAVRLLKFVCRAGAMILACSGAVQSVTILKASNDLSIFTVAVLGVAVTMRFPDATRLYIYGACYSILFGYMWADDHFDSVLVQNSLFVLTIALIFDRVSYFASANNFLKTRRILELNDLLVEEDLNKSHMLGIAIHDLKSPLSGIAATSRLLKENPDDFPPEERREILEEIEASAHRLFGNVEQLVNLASLNASDARPTPEVFDAGEMIRETVRNQSYQASFKSITIYTKFAGDMLPLYSDRALASRILDNLLSNAIKFTPPESSVWVRAARNDAEKQLTFEVIDEGPGFSDRDRERLFAPYKRSASGGLGLYLAKQLCDKLGGSIELAANGGDESNELGARFVVTLPDLG